MPDEHLEPIVLADGYLSAQLVPAKGGAVETLSVKVGEGQWLPIFDTRPDRSRDGFFALGCNILAPFSNRISGGGFAFGGQFHPLVPNIAGEPYPNHGNAFSKVWQVESHSASQAVLTLEAAGPGPFRYHARLTYELIDCGFEARLELANRGHIALPFGGGFHPWFARTPGTRLRVMAEGVWTETADHLPDHYLGLGDSSAYDLRHGAPLPRDFANVAYAGWDGVARIEWPETEMALEMTAAAPLRVLMLYSPGEAATFFSLEPVSHTVDAHNRTGVGVVPPQILVPGDSLSLRMRLTPMPINEFLGGPQ